jgi:hypothetical protein
MTSPERSLHPAGGDDASEHEAFAAIRRFLSFLPSNAALPAPSSAFTANDTEVLNHLVPANTRQTCDTRRVIEHIADAGSTFEIKPTYGANMVIEGSVDVAYRRNSRTPRTRSRGGRKSSTRFARA